MLRNAMRWAAMGLMIVAAGAASWAAEPHHAFGGGGPSIGTFMAEIEGINAFLVGAGFAPFDGDLLLLGGGGRGGVAPGVTFGGAGWGAWSESHVGDRHAEFGVGLGGFDLGLAIGGSDRAVLAVGVLLGGGAAELILTEDSPIPINEVLPRGIVVEPEREAYDSAFILVAPYVDVQIQILDWVGFAVRAGYAWTPLELNFRDDGPLNPPRLSPSGFYVRLSIAFGAITPLGEERPPL